jgi:hypothetical protein
MSTRLSVSNWVLPISLRQFQLMVSEYKILLQTAFGTTCSLQIRVMNQPKWAPNLCDDPNPVEDVNNRATFFEATDPFDVPREIFLSAAYVEVVVRPVDKSAAPTSAYGHIEFKGLRPRQATYYLQPGDQNVVRILQKRHRGQRLGDGYTFNSDS